MTKLTEMSLEELWLKFPIVLTAHKSEWKAWYEDENANLCKLLDGEKILRISHIGSTAMDKIQSKPIIDILVEVQRGENLRGIKNILERNGYICMSEYENRISLNKGYMEDGFAERVFHIHLRFYDDNDELYFRDYLNENPTLAKQYEELKLSLWEKHEFDRDGYTKAKETFINEHTQAAKIKYKNKYL